MAGRLRITGGNLGGRLIDVPKAADSGLLRPTPDRVRGAIFSSLGAYVKDARVLDLFAGSGSQSFEALSRGASSAILVEVNRHSAETIKKNAKNLGVDEVCQVIVGSATKLPPELSKGSFDLVFADPPYKVKVDEGFFEAISKLLSSDGIVVFRCEKLDDFERPNGFEVIRERKYGGTAVFFLRRSS